MDDLHGNQLTAAILLLFKNRLCLPAYPFKILLQSLLNNEIATASTITDYVSIPEEKAVMFIKLAVFGESECVGGKHLSKLINSRSMKELKDTAQTIKIAFGEQTTAIKTERIEADFIEVFSVSSFLSQQIAQPRQHRLQTTLEVIVGGKGTFEECLALFIRRILEDAHKSDQSPLMVSSVLCVREGSGGHGAPPQDIDIRSMKAKRQQVLTALKTAVVNDGEIWLDFYLVADKTLLAFHADSVPYRETSSGFIHVTRRYKLSYRNEKGEVRCFSRLPMESAATGVFLSLREAQLVVAVGREHLARSSKPTNALPTTTTTSATPSIPRVESSSSSAADLDGLISHMCLQTMHLWDQGEATEAAQLMLVLQCLMVDRRKEATHCMLQLRHTTSGLTGHIRAIRDAVISLKNCIDMLVGNISNSSAVASQAREVALNGEEGEDIEKLTKIFERLSPAVSQIRTLVVELVRVQTHSELQYLAPRLTGLVWALFHKDNKTLSVLHSSLVDIAQRGLLSTIRVLQFVADTLSRLDASLKMLETSVAMETLMRIASHDLLSYAPFEAHSLRTKRSLDRGEGDIPRCFVDLLGYCIARHEHANKANSSDSENKKSSHFVWRPWHLSDMLRSQMALNNSKQRTEVEDRAALSANPEEAVYSLSNLWDLYGILGEYLYARHGGVDFIVAIKDETLRYDVPRFMAVEGAKIRYLEETQVLRAMHEAVFFASTLAEKRPKFPAICTELFRYPLFLQLWRGVENSLIEGFAFQPVRRNHLMSTATHKNAVASGAYKVGIRHLPSRLKNLISGGVFGSDRLLSVLGPRVDVVFQNMWNLPPLLPSPPVSSLVGVSIKMYCGLAAETAIDWCIPDISKLRAGAAVVDAAETTTGGDNDEAVGGPQIDKKSVFNRVFGKNATDEQDGESFAVRSDHASPFETDVKEAARREPDPDLGQLRCSDTMQLEVVVKISYEHAEGLAKARALFAGEVSRCARHLICSSNWNLERAVVFRDPQLTSDLSSERLLSRRVFSRADLSDDHHNEVFPALEMLVSKHGTCTLEGSLSVPEHESRLNSSDMVKLFEKLLSHSDNTASDLDTIANNVKERLVGKPTDFLAAQEAPPTAVAPHALFGWHADTHDEEEVDSTDSQVDPTHCDVDRLCADSLISQLIQKRQAGGIRCFVPCRIRFTLLAQLANRSTWKQSLLNTKPQYSRITGQQSNPLTVGSDHDIARLVASTLWFSPEASRAVWGCARNGEAHCVVHETKARWTAHRNCLEAGDMCRSYQHAFISVALSQNYQLVAPLFRAFNGLAFKLSRAIHWVAACRGILEAYPSSQCDAVALGMTLSRYVCLSYRHLLLSPQSIHLRGGCAHILQCVNQLEATLRLRPIEMSAALTKLPTQLVARTPSSSSSSLSSAVEASVVVVKYRTEPESKPLKVPPAFRPVAPSSSLSDVTVMSNSQLDRNASAAEGKTTGAGNQSSVPPGAKRPVRIKQPTASGEAEFRRALSTPRDVAAACILLRTIEDCSHALLHCLSRDSRTNFLELEDSLKESPAMKSGQEVMDILLGDDCDLDALLAFIHRNESPTNKQLEDADFITSLDALGSGEDYRGLRSADDSADAVGILKRIAQLSKGSTRFEKAALTEIVKSTLKLGVSSGDSAVVSAAGGLSVSNSAASLQSLDGGPLGSAKTRGAPHLAKSVGLITTLLKGLKSKVAAPLQINTDDFHSVLEGGQISGDDSMQFTPDRILGASNSGDKLQNSFGLDASTPVSGRLHDAATKMNVARMFSLHETAHEEETPRPVARTGLVLSRFHEEEVTKQRRLLERERATDGAVPYDSYLSTAGTGRVPLLPSVSLSLPSTQTFSTSGFQLVGDSVKDAAQSQSMLHLLRVYSGTQSQPVSGQNVLPRFISVGGAAAGSGGTTNNESVLQALRNLPIAPRGDEW